MLLDGFVQLELGRGHDGIERFDEKWGRAGIGTARWIVVEVNIAPTIEVILLLSLGVTHWEDAKKSLIYISAS